MSSNAGPRLRACSVSPAPSFLSSVLTLGNAISTKDYRRGWHRKRLLSYFELKLCWSHSHLLSPTPFPSNIQAAHAAPVPLCGAPCTLGCAPCTLAWCTLHPAPCTLGGAPCILAWCTASCCSAGVGVTDNPVCFTALRCREGTLTSTTRYYGGSGTRQPRFSGFCSPYVTALFHNFISSLLLIISFTSDLAIKQHILWYMN